MADTDVNVKIKADDKWAQKLRRAGKQAFDRKDVREFTRAAGDLERQMGTVLKRQISLTNEMSKVDKGTKAYKDLRAELKGINQEATQVERSLGRVRQVLQRQQQDQERAQTRARQQRQGFVGGMAQGLGVAQYVPTGAEQMPRIGGAMLGGGIRRAVGGAAAPFLTPGIGGMATALGAIPLAGGFAAGALQTMAGAYQSAVGFQRQQRGMLAYQGPQAGQLVTGRRQGAAANLRIAQQEVAAARIQQETAQGGRGPAAAQARLAEDAALTAEARKRGTSRENVLLMEAQVNLQRRLTGGEGRGRAARPAPSVGTPAMIQAQRNVVKATQADKDAADTRIKAAQEGLRSAKALAQPTRRRLTGLPGAGAGMRFGMGPQEMNQLFGQMMGVRGGTYGGVEQAQFTEAMAAQTAFGVTGQQAGQFARMGIRGGGGRGMGQGLAGVLQAAVAQGLRGSQVTEYLQSLVQLGQQAERSGVKINVQEFTRGAATLTAAGLQGLQAQRVATGMQQAAMGVSQRGVQSPIDVLLARSAGFDPSQGPEGYARAMNKMAGGMTSDMMNKLMANLTEGAGARGFGPEMQTMMLRRAMGRMGVQVGPGQASNLLKSYREGTIESSERLQKMLTAGEAPGAGEWLTGRAERKVRLGAPLTVGAAALEAKRIGVGARAAPTIVALENASLNAAKTLNNLPIATFAKAVESATKAINTFVASGGLEKLTEKLMKLGGIPDIPGT